MLLLYYLDCVFWCKRTCEISFSDLDFWRNRERQFLEFYEQLDEKIGLFLAATRSPCLDIYKQISEIAEKGIK